MEDNKEFGEENSFICFRADGFYWTVSLMDVVRISSDCPDNCIPVRIGSVGGIYKIIVGHSDQTLAIEADEVIGLMQIPPALQFELPPAARSDGSSFVGGVCRIEAMDTLGYLLDFHELYRIQKGGGDNE